MAAEFGFVVKPVKRLEVQDGCPEGSRLGNEAIFLHLKGHAASQAVADYPVNRLSGFDEIVIGLVCLLVALGFASVSPSRYFSEIVPPISASNGPFYVFSSRIGIVIDALPFAVSSL